MAYALLVALLEVQRSSSETIPFDNPFWVEWLRGQRRSGRPTTISEVGSNEGTLQRKLTSKTFSTETVPLFQPLFPRKKANTIEKGKVISPTVKTQLDSGYVNEHDSDGQLSIQRLNRKVSPINGKSALNTNSFESNTFKFSATDAQNDVSINRFLENKNNNNEKQYIEENRSSSNLLPIDILNSNEFVWPNTPNSPSVSSSFSNDNNFDGEVFVTRDDDILEEDELSYNLITSTLTPTIRPTGEKLFSKDFFLKNKQRKQGTTQQFSEDDFNKYVDDSVSSKSVSFVSMDEANLMIPMTTTAYPISSTTSTPSTTTRTLVASWPAVRSRNIGASRAETRFRKRVPLSSSQKSVRRNKVPSRRRQNLKRKNQNQNRKRRRQTIIPQFKSATTSIPVITTSSTVPSTTTQSRDTIKTTVSRTPSSSTTTIYTTTTTLTSSTTKTTTTTTETSTSTTPAPTVAPTTSAATFVFTNLRTASALVVTRNVTSTRVVTAPIPEVEENEEEATFATTTEMTSTDRDVVSTKHSVIEEDVSPKNEVKRFPIETEIDSTSTEMSQEYVNIDDQYIQDEETVEYEHQEHVENFIPMPSNINQVKVEEPGVRSPRLTDLEEPTHILKEEEVQGILSGEYHEMNPGQYHEVDPGQYHEPNPGQYHETNPGQPVALGENQEVQSGQYHEEDPGQPVSLAQKDGEVVYAGEYQEVNPGQYHEINPGQYHEVNPGQYIDDTSKLSDISENKAELVGVQQTDNAKIYNVQQRVNEFIIGEYGTISNSGQTLQGVRYTAVADDHSGIDPNFIYETLVKYFPMAAQKFAESSSKAAS